MSVEIRFKLDEQIDLDLLRDIVRRANGGSIHQAAKILFVELRAVVNHNFPQLDANCGGATSPPRHSGGNTDDQLTDALAEIGGVFGETNS